MDRVVVALWTSLEKQREALGGGLRVDRGYHGATPGADLHHAPRHEESHGLPNYRSRYAELVTELAFGGHPVTGLQAVFADAVQQRFGDTVGEPNTLHRRRPRTRFTVPGG